MSYASLFDLLLFIAAPIVAWRFLGKPFLAWWRTIRGVTGIKFVPKRPDQE